MAKKFPLINHRSSYSDLSMIEIAKNKSMKPHVNHIMKDRFETMVDEVIQEERRSPKRKESMPKRFASSLDVSLESPPKANPTLRKHL